MKRFLQIVGLLWRPLCVNGAFFVFMFALGYLCTQTEVRLHIKGAKPYELSATELFFDLYLVCAVLALIPSKVRKWVRLLLAVLFYAVALIDMFCYVHFESTLTPTMLMLFFETTGREAKEFLGSYMGWDMFTSKTGWVLLIAMLHTLWAMCSGWLKRQFRKTHLQLTESAARCSQAVLGVATLSLFIYCASECWTNKQAIHRLMTKSNLGEVEHELTNKDCANLYLPIHRMVFSLYANRLASQQIEHLVKATEQVQVDSCSFLRQANHSPPTSQTAGQHTGCIH